MDESRFSHHQACPDCGSSDGLAIYRPKTGETEPSAYCFVCASYFKEAPPGPKARRNAARRGRELKPLIEAQGNFSDRFRGIDSKVLEQYGVSPYKSGACFDYRDSSGSVVAQKIRTEGQTFWRGEPASIVGFGAHLANPDKHQAVAITEGEIDAASVTEAMNGKIIGISVPNGAQSAAAFVKKQLDFFLRFTTVYVLTDMDEPGQAAAKSLVELFPAGQVRRVILPKKDANAVLTELGPFPLRDAIHAAKETRPDGIRSSRDFQGIALVPPNRKAVDYGFGFWNQKTQLYDNQLVILVAGSGVGKTTMARHLAIKAMESGIKVGWIGLEETVEESIHHFVGMKAGIQLHARTNYQGIKAEEAARMIEADAFVCQGGALELFDHFGSLDEAVVLRRMNYMVRSLDCRLLFLDHLTILGSGFAKDVQHLDATVTKIRSFIASTKCTVVAINHLSRGDKSRNMEDGGVPELHDIRGSHSIVQLADTVWAAGRKRGEQLTHTYCLKNRMLGRCGYAGSLEFDEDSQQFTEKWVDPSTDYGF